MTTPITLSDASIITSYGAIDGPLRDVPSPLHLPILLLRSVRNGKVPEAAANEVLAHLGILRSTLLAAPAQPVKGYSKPSASAKKAAK
jgi:hypothetical protein